MHPRTSGHAVALRIVRAARWLVPRHLRADWLAEWDGELAAWAAEGRRGLPRRAGGAFSDALWLRQRHVADVAWFDDLRHGCRHLRQHSGFAVTAIGILAVGMAASVTAFGVVTQVLLRPLPYPEPDRLVTVWERRASLEGRQDVAPGNFLDWKARATSFQFLAGAEPYSRDFTGGERPEVWPAANVTEGFFESFGVQPQIGRLFRPQEYTRGQHRVAILSAGLWRSRFAGDASVVGRRITLDGEPFDVVGVMPGDFLPLVLEDVPGEIAVWSPKYIEDHEPRIRASGYWQVVGRLAPGVSLDQARAEMDAVGSQLEREWPSSNRGARVDVITMREHLVGDVRAPIALFAGAVGLVLLIACVNVTNLLLARGVIRRQELSVRAALGAARGRLVAQLLVESLLLALLSGAAALALAMGATRALALLGPREVPWLDTLHVDGWALLFALALAVVVAVVSGLLPAARLAGRSLAPASSRTATAARGQQRLRSTLVAAEVALALVLVAAAAVLLRSFVGLVNVDTGFTRQGVAVWQVFAWDRNPGPERLRAFFDQTLTNLGALPGVEVAGAVSAMPFIETNIDVRGVLRLIGDPAPPEGEEARTSLTVATPGYFEAMRIPVLRGRGLEARDGPDGPGVAVISEALAARYWSGRDPVGRRVALRFNGRAAEVEIVGVVGALRHERLDEPPRPELVMPLAQMPSGSMTFVARTTIDPRTLIESGKQAVWAVDPLQTFYRTATLDELVSRTVSTRRFALVVLAGFAAVALLLAASGLYGVLTAIAAQYRREIGVRMAMGARWIDILRLVLGRGLVVVFAGLGMGLVGSVGGLQLLRRFLYGVAPADPWALGGAALALLLVAAPACLLPARRAAGADPSEALRAE